MMLQGLTQGGTHIIISIHAADYVARRISVAEGGPLLVVIWFLKPGQGRDRPSESISELEQAFTCDCVPEHHNAV